MGHLFMVAEHLVSSSIIGKEHVQVKSIEQKSYNLNATSRTIVFGMTKKRSRASTTARTTTHGAESRGRTAACEKAGKSQREPLFCGDSWDFFLFRPRGLVRGPIYSDGT